VQIPRVHSAQNHCRTFMPAIRVFMEMRMAWTRNIPPSPGMDSPHVPSVETCFRVIPSTYQERHAAMPTVLAH
ncbi:hypothetical protein, partial [uncultured Bifidobacterium sp.]|uniref:hypothetical protein n=1 Tax=uncultured Bifidobacterium sp. TaxID=165187 RepID=UPI0026266E4F